MVMGFLSGLGLGLNFQRENWLGGYSSLKRRLYRLCHIAFFGLGAVNLLFYFSLPPALAASRGAAVASSAFIIGGILMPACCLLMAHFPRTRLLFGLPVASLLLGGVLMVLLAVQAPPIVSGPAAAHAPAALPVASTASP